ncbi:hypothetical protein VCNHCC008D_003341A, partial [Vibrio cholerae O1 str. NHCC-008D]
MVAVVVF